MNGGGKSAGGCIHGAQGHPAPRHMRSQTLSSSLIPAAVDLWGRDSTIFLGMCVEKTMARLLACMWRVHRFFVGFCGEITWGLHTACL